MLKFKVLVNNERFLMCLGIPSYRFANELSDSSSFYDKFLALFTTHSDRLIELTNGFFGSILPYYMLLIAFSIPVSSLLFIHENWPKMELISRSCLAFVASSQVFGMLLGFGIQMNTIKDINRQLQEIIDREGVFQISLETEFSIYN